MDSSIRQRILQLNPWLMDPAAWAEELDRRVPGNYIERNVRLGDLAQPGTAQLIVGPRQAGKSTLVWRYLRDHAPHTLLFLNAEEDLVRRWCASAAGLVSDLRGDFPSVRTVFIDEAQHLDEAGLLIKGLVDARRGLEILVTGSSSFHLAARTRESLAGRAERSVLLPFSLGEVTAHAPPAVPAARREDGRRKAARMLVWGGYPAVWLGHQPARVLSNLVEAFVLRDASDRFHIQRPDALRALLQLAAGQVGQMVNLAEWASIAGISAPTAREYLAILEESWVLHQLPAFAGGRRREITTAKRLHFYDPGLRNALLDTFSDDIERRPDRGMLMEGLAFAELAKALPRDWSIRYWRAKGGAEVDFVLVRGDRLVGVEVKAGRRARLTRSSRSFVDAYAPSDLVLVTGLEQQEGEPQLAGKTRIHRLGLGSLAVGLEGLAAGA